MFEGIYSLTVNQYFRYKLLPKKENHITLLDVSLNYLLSFLPYLGHNDTVGA